MPLERTRDRMRRSNLAPHAAASQGNPAREREKTPEMSLKVANCPSQVRRWRRCDARGRGRVGKD